MNEKELAELTDATVKAIKAELGYSHVHFPASGPDWDVVWTLVGNALAEAYRRGAGA